MPLNLFIITKALPRDLQEQRGVVSKSILTPSKLNRKKKERGIVLNGAKRWIN
jgi:hypothetical protein